ncbi:MAG: hypothetical protein GEU79_03615 [Acidimicrobiia bacterium]|nr:hypothetical protein [Acidimicrobiia bacterium]
MDVLIVGGGFGGLEVARSLDEKAQVTIVSTDNFLLFSPMLAEVAAGDIDPRHILTPIRHYVPRARFIQGEAVDIDPDQKTVRVAPGFDTPEIELSADALVLSLGSVPADFGIPGVGEHTIGFKNIGDALQIRNRALALLEAASTHPDPNMTRFAIIGAGYSGVELAGSLADMLEEASTRFYPTAPLPKVILIDAADRVAPTLRPSLGAAAERALVERGVEVHLGRAVKSIDSSGVHLADGDHVAANTAVWAAGVRPNPLMAEIGLPVNEKGRLVVDGNLRAAPGVFGVGDCAAVPDGSGDISPPTGQFAIREGRYLGRNLPGLLAGRAYAPFHYRTLGELVALGHRNAVGQVLGVPVSGFPAWVIWRSYYLNRLPGIQRKARVGMDWMADLLFPQDVAWLPSSELGPPLGG